ncbi:hypothetical protein [Pseudomonas sp. GV071]|uniref:hypothetical protein n=1 Tax=Pseudomonas sp. GV071 TaxID=2135754 RepID=UPI000D33F276|nr:hypothetical protein [Pseudomonas sp. GV071]PTQ70101.1 hypothetical protein C8K61_107317 [Pseudomonas sp. GV071]
MDRPRFAHRQRAVVLLVVCAILSSCISVPTGTSRLYRKNDDKVATATTSATPAKPAADTTTVTAADKVIWDKTVFSNKVSSELTIRQAPGGADKTGADVFAIYLSDGYFKYLKDLGGVNEVIVIAQFTETNAGTEADTVTRILGPHFGVSDNAGIPALGELLYGPKNLDADHLHMKLTVLEYDQGENANTAAFLEFIDSVTKTISLANPVTAAERAFAKEIAASLLSLNKDDVVMTININFTGNAGDLANQGRNGSFIPLNVGDYVLINKEHCVPANCYFQLSRDGEMYNPFAWIGDVALLVPTAMRRAWTDTPDHASLDDVDMGALTYEDHILAKKSSSSVDPYTDKTWLGLSIVRGGNAALWQKRKLLSQAEQSIQSLIKMPGEGISFSQNYDTAQKALGDARKIESLNNSGIVFVLPVDSDGAFVPTAASSEYCLYHARTITDIAASFYRLDTNGIPQQLAASDISKNTAKTTPNNTCFTVASSGRSPGTYDMVAAYKVGGEVLTQKVRYKIEK